MSAKNKPFIPDPSGGLQSRAKYTFGDTSSKISEFKHHKPVFAFDFVSLSRTDFCFNSKLIDAKKDYVKIIEGLKKLSFKTYDELSKDPAFHFHEVDFNSTVVSQSVFVKCLTSTSNKEQCPTVYQFEIFGSARIFGFIHNWVFYPVLFDRNHNVYKRK